MTDKEKYQLILNLLGRLNIHGQDDVLTMYNLMNFVMKEIQLQIEKEKKLLDKGGWIDR